MQIKPERLKEFKRKYKTFAKKEISNVEAFDALTNLIGLISTLNAINERLRSKDIEVSSHRLNKRIAQEISLKNVKIKTDKTNTVSRATI